MLSTLLDPSQPTWFLEQSTRLVALLATRMLSFYCRRETHTDSRCNSQGPACTPTSSPCPKALANSRTDSQDRRTVRLQTASDSRRSNVCALCSSIPNAPVQRYAFHTQYLLHPSVHSHSDYRCSRRFEQAESMRSSILSTLTLLALAHGGALAILKECHSVILSLISFLTNLTVPLWEEDQALMRSQALITSCVPPLLPS